MHLVAGAAMPGGDREFVGGGSSGAVTWVVGKSETRQKTRLDNSETTQEAREDQPEECINPAVETEGGNASTPNLSASPNTSAPVPISTSTRVHSSEDWRSFRDFVTGPRNWYWLVWILVDKFVFDAIVSYYTNLGANRTSSRMDDGVDEEMAISLAKSIMEYIGNGTMTNGTLTANPTPISDGSIRYLNLCRE
ncbi:hypothetical protein Q9L58_005893 [Maublancomyces gigas]|uniref:Uncharacterized protein n=1 Tax=Discina gigas TaxID=1032678 RepID=A0ABR3GH60_9PEZI